MIAGGCQGMYKRSPVLVLVKLQKKNHALMEICLANPDLVNTPKTMMTG